MLQRFDLDFDHGIARCLMLHQRKRGLQRGLDAARRHDVIFLDQNAVVQADAVIESAARAHRIFLRTAQARQCFTGIKNFRVGTHDGIHKQARFGGNCRQRLQKIQRRAFGREHRARVAGDLAKLHAGRDMLAILDVPENFAIGIEFIKATLKPLNAGDDAILAREHPRMTAGHGRNQRRRQIAVADILRQGAADVFGNHCFEIVFLVRHGDNHLTC